jgi:hypothetical protein
MDRTRELANAAADEVRWFADSLVSKRLREVEKRLPLTRQTIGSKEFERQFRSFADAYTSTSVKKHVEDALEFADRLISDRGLNNLKRNIATFESRRLRHNSLDEWISLCVIRFDPRSMERTGIGFWVAFRGWSRIFFRSRQQG